VSQRDTSSLCHSEERSDEESAGRKKSRFIITKAIRNDKSDGRAARCKAAYMKSRLFAQ
jgi:hypothetical protein